MIDVNRLLEIAFAEVGYLEKKTNAQLESKTANAGMNNFTKYGKAQGCNGQPWCDAFIDWCFTQAYGKEKAKQLLGGFSNYTPTSAQYFKNMGRWYKDPQVGDVIFFKNSQRICHTGLVYKVQNGVVYTVEGNTSAGATVIANGGGVCKKQYSVTNSRIAGYGRPAYDNITVAATTVQKKETYNKTQFLADVKKALNANNSNLLTKTVTISKDKNNKHPVVLPVQKYLNAIGYSCGKADGEAGSKFDTALKAYQFKIVGLKNPDGEATAGGKTWKKLLDL